MRTIETEVYNPDELSITSRDRAIQNLYDINVDYDWWESVYEDANNINCKINGFDIDRGSYCELVFEIDAGNTALKILENHGKQCNTYKAAEEFLKELERLHFLSDLFLGLYEKYEEIDGEENNHYLWNTHLQHEDDIEYLIEEFQSDLSNDYLSMLRKEYDYRISDEAIIETIECNEYEFDENGILV